jgi:hypothetical protein
MMGCTSRPVTGAASQNREKIVGIGAQRGKDAADVGVLQRKAELNAEKAEAHVPQLPERQYGLTGRVHAARPDYFKICSKITRAYACQMIELPCKIRKKAIHREILVSNVAKQQNKTTTRRPDYMTIDPLPHCRPDPAGQPRRWRRTPTASSTATQRDGVLEVRTSDGLYLIKPYSTGIVETTLCRKAKRPIRPRMPWCWRRR